MSLYHNEVRHKYVIVENEKINEKNNENTFVNLTELCIMPKNSFGVWLYCKKNKKLYNFIVKKI